jgi:hypothetical protein
MSLVGGFGCTTDDLADYSVGRSAPIRVSQRFPPAGNRYHLRPVLTLGRPDGDSVEAFGFVTDAAFGLGDSIYVADAGQQRVLVFDGRGTFARSIGRAGQGPGEFLDPSSIALIADTLFVYDGRQGRVSVLSTTGTYYRAFPPPSAWATRVRASGRNTLLFTVAADSFIVHEMSTAGRAIQTYVPRPTVEARLPPEAIPGPGPVCGIGESFLYANVWRYEVVRVALGSTRELAAQQYPSGLLRPKPPRDGAKGSVAPAGGHLGLVCSESIRLLGYLSLESGQIHYDLLDSRGYPIVRFQFARDGIQEYPGFLTDARANHVLAFRSRPYPQVGVWVVEKGAD